MRILLDLNETSIIDDALLVVCKEYKKIDENVCLGAVSEYKVIYSKEIAVIENFIRVH